METDGDPVHKQDRGLHKPSAEELKSIDTQPIRLGEEKSVLPSPRVRQPGSIGAKVSRLFPDLGPKVDSFDRLFGEDIEIEKIFPRAEKQV